MGVRIGLWLLINRKIINYGQVP